MNDKPSVIVVGGGIIGGAVALELAGRGMNVTVIDKGALSQEASNAAAGMLGAHVETHHDGPFFELCKASQRLYSQWTSELHELSGISPQYISQGIVRVALSADDERELRNRLPWIDSGKWLEPAEIRDLEPTVTPDVRGGIFFSRDHQVHPVHLLRSLHTALRVRGSRILEWTPVHKLVTRAGKVTGVVTAQGELSADLVVVAAGAWSEPLLREAGVNAPMMPVKGQCYAVRPSTPLIRHTVFTRGCYLVPRLDGTITIGATQLEAGFDKTPTAAAIAALHGIASRVLPAIEDAAFATTWTGLRPGTPDGLPYIGAVDGVGGLLLATGHFRNGILLAPITAAVIGSIAAGETPSVNLDPYRPNRAPVTVDA